MHILKFQHLLTDNIQNEKNKTCPNIYILLLCQQNMCILLEANKTCTMKNSNYYLLDIGTDEDCRCPPNYYGVGKSCVKFIAGTFNWFQVFFFQIQCRGNVTSKVDHTV